MNPVRKAALIFIVVPMVMGGILALSSCGGGNGPLASSSSTSSASSTSSQASQGSVRMFITDAATDKFNQILVTITKITLIAPDGTQQVVSTKTTTVDLSKITDFSQFLAQNGITAGTYSKIQLDVSNIVLNEVDSNGNIIDTQSVTLPSGKIDINPQQTISVASGGQQTVEMDFDANDSFKLTTTGNGKVIFRPVIFVHELSEQESEPGRLVKEHGDITSPDLQTNTFKLCSLDHQEMNECLNVAFDSSTAMYDSKLATITPDGLVENTEVTVFGHLVKDSNGTHIQASILVLGPNGTLSSAGGLVSTAPDSNGQMTVTVKAGESVPAGDMTVQLAGSVQIFSRATGKSLTESNLTAGTPVLLVGQYDSSTKVFTAIAVSVADHTTEVEGTVTSITPAQGSQPMTLTVSTSTGNQCVQVSQNTRIALNHDQSDDVVSLGSASGIKVGQTISAKGVEASDKCLSADNVVMSGSEGS